MKLTGCLYDIWIVLSQSLKVKTVSEDDKLTYLFITPQFDRNECKTQQEFQINSDLPACGGVEFRNHQLEVFSHPGDDADARQDAFIGTDR